MLGVLCEEVHALWYLGNLSLVLFLLLVFLLLQNQKKEFYLIKEVWYCDLKWDWANILPVKNNYFTLKAYHLEWYLII